MPIDAVLKDPSTSEWLKHALRTALLRDPVDAVHDAQALVRHLDEHLELLGAAMRRQYDTSAANRSTKP